MILDLALMKVSYARILEVDIPALIKRLINANHKKKTITQSF